METFTLSQDLLIMFVKAASFPDGIQQAFDQLASLLENGLSEKHFVGLSKPENGVIEYKAGVQAEQGEAERLALSTLLLPKGLYWTQMVSNWKNEAFRIGSVFEQLLEHPSLDPSSYCIEWYKGDDVLCMVKLKEV